MMLEHGMDLTLIPPDPDEEPREIKAVGSTENTNGTWGLRVSTKTTSGTALSELREQYDLADWDAVASRGDDVIVAGAIIGVTKTNHKYIIKVRPDEAQPDFAAGRRVASPPKP